MIKQLEIMGLDLSEQVVKWGSLEQVKELQLSQAVMFTNEHSIEMDNSKGIFSEYGSKSILAGAKWFGKPLKLIIDNVIVYSGIITNIIKDDERKIATIVSQNFFKTIAETTFVGSATSMDPAGAILGMLLTVLDESKINLNSFNHAGTQARKAGATVSYNFDGVAGITVMNAIQQIANLASLSIYEENGKIRANIYKEYRGPQSGLRFTIDDSIVETWGAFTRNSTNFTNQCKVFYTKDDYEEAINAESFRANKVYQTIEFVVTEGGNAALAHDRYSALWFAQNYVNRAGNIRASVDITGGPELWDIQIGQRFAVTRADGGYSNYPMECFEIHWDLDEELVEASFAGLIAA